MPKCARMTWAPRIWSSLMVPVETSSTRVLAQRLTANSLRVGSIHHRWGSRVKVVHQYHHCQSIWRQSRHHRTMAIHGPPMFTHALTRRLPILEPVLRPLLRSMLRRGRCNMCLLRRPSRHEDLKCGPRHDTLIIRVGSLPCRCITCCPCRFLTAELCQLCSHHLSCGRPAHRRLLLPRHP